MLSSSSLYWGVFCFLLISLNVIAVVVKALIFNRLLGYFGNETYFTLTWNTLYWTEILQLVPLPLKTLSKSVPKDLRTAFTLYKKMITIILNSIINTIDLELHRSLCLLLCFLESISKKKCQEMCSSTTKIIASAIQIFRNCSNKQYISLTPWFLLMKNYQKYWHPSESNIVLSTLGVTLGNLQSIHNLRVQSGRHSLIIAQILPC